MNFTYAFTVEGEGPFPFDMLRYDQCWPGSPDSVLNLDHINRTGTRRVYLQSDRMPTGDRWASFGWRVTAWDKL